MYWDIGVWVESSVHVGTTLHCKNEWVILTLIWLHEFQFLLRLYKSIAFLYS